MMSAPARGLFADAAPMVLTRVGLALMGLTDIVMLARHAPEALAMAAMVEGSYGRGLDIAIAAILSALPIATLAWSAGDAAAFRAVWRRALVAALGLGLGLAALAPFAEGLLLALGQPAALVPGAAMLVAVASAGGIVGLIAIACALPLEASGRASAVARAVLAGLFGNLLLNLLLIEGGLGLPALGALGSAIATALVRLALMLWLLRLAARPVAPPVRGHAPTGLARRQLRAGLAAAGIAAAMHGFGLMLTMMAGWLGPLGLAAYAAAWALHLPMMVVVSGLGDALALRIARDAGEGEGTDLARLVALVTVPALLLALMAPVLAGVLATDPALRVLLATLLPISALVLWLDALSLLLLNALRGRQVFVLPAIAHAASMALAVPLAWWLAFGTERGVSGMVMAIAATSALRLGGMAMLFVARRARPALAAR